MRLWNRLASAFALSLILSSTAAAEMALLPAEDYSVRVGQVILIADVSVPETRISSPDDDSRPDWVIPAAPRLFSLSADGDAILAIHEGKHTTDLGPYNFVATVYRRDGSGFVFQHFALSGLLPIREMPLEDAGYRWLDSYRVTSDGWALRLANGDRVRLSIP